MSLIDQALTALRRAHPVGRRANVSESLAQQLSSQGVDCVAIGGPLQQRWQQAMQELHQCIRPLAGDTAVLNEGGVYDGCWTESTGTINTEMLSRFAPETATATFRLFADHQRADGLIPYKVTADGPAYSQIQIVTPLARSVWNHYQLHRHGVPGSREHRPDREWLAMMYQAMVRYDQWLMTYRNTRSTGCVEAFCTFDTGHDLSPRFWFAPERCLDHEATQCDPEAVTMPYVAPDLTAYAICQRRYLSLIAEEIGEDSAGWETAADDMLEALFTQCYDSEDGLFYDRDAQGRAVRVNSDVLLRVLANEIGDADFFEAALQRYVFHTRHFLSHYGFTSVSMSDPRFSGDHTRNSWAGPVNMLTQIRAPHAFEHHQRPAELAVAHRPLWGALLQADTFPQCIDPWSGEAGYTSVYSPGILWFLDAVERWSGILPTSDAHLWFTALAPTRMNHGVAVEALAHSRTVDGARFEFASDDAAAEVWIAGHRHLSFPRGWRVITDRSGEPTAVVGVAPHTVTGVLIRHREGDADTCELTLAPNERVELSAMKETGRRAVGFMAPAQ